jgi:diguanylate cyclase (GGDEF)-like protein/hemerythrin-like metal-binding protein
MERATSESTGAAAVLRAFMDFAAPLALATLDGTVVLVNEGWTARFGSAGLGENAARIAEGGERDRRLALHLPGRAVPVEVRVRVVRAPEHVLLIAGYPGTSDYESELDRLRDRVGVLELLAATDHLTGAWSRGHFDRSIDAELARDTAGRQPLSLVLFDIDHFKRINDEFGHAVGDSVLRELVDLVQSRTRASDSLFRWGGDEFVILAASAGYRGAERLAENLRRTVAGHSFQTVGATTLSVGVVERVETESAPALFSRLDAALYAAKEAGRNRVVVDRRGDSDLWLVKASASPLHLQWHEAYESGDATIDGEHRELFELANQLISAAAQAEAEPERFGAALDALLEHARHHFVDEEAILAAHGYADLEQHKRAHAGLLRRAVFLRERVDEGKATLGAIVEYLAQDVIARHMMVVDRAFFPLFERT